LEEVVSDTNVVICSGDISPSIIELQETLELIKEKIYSDYYIFVPGNHDIWDLELQKYKNKQGISMQKYEIDLPNVTKRAGFYFLPGNPLIIEDEFAFIGSIGWYDYTLRNHKWDEFLKLEQIRYEEKYYMGRYLNELNYSNWGMTDKEVVEEFSKRLKEDLEKVQKIENKMMILHYLPFQQSIDYKETLEGDYFSAFMGAKIFGELIREFNFSVAIHGHTHTPLMYRLDDIRIFCCPIGYPMEWTKQLEEEINLRVKKFSF